MPVRINLETHICTHTHTAYE